jgi:NADH-quinone oxidoreductase subunit J
MLPRPRPYPRLRGTAAAAAALLLGGWLLIRGGTVHPETFLFYAFAAIAVAAGGLLVTQQNPVRAALAFALVILAIIVTFLFVIMLAQQEGLSDADARSREPLLASVGGFVLLGALLFVLHETAAGEKQWPLARGVEAAQDGQGRAPMPAENVAHLGRTLFTDYLVPVELAGVLLLVATVGAIVITHRRAEGPR